MSLVLYGFPLSANSHKVSLMLSLLQLRYDDITVDLATDEHRAPDFAALSPVRTVPLLVDDTLRIFDSHAAVIYLCQQYHGEQWLPPGPGNLALVSQWLYYEATELFNGIGYARNHVTFRVPCDLSAAQARGRSALRLLNEHLAQHPWLALDRATVADVSCYPLVSVAEEAGLTLEPYPHLRNWLSRLEALAGFRAMPLLGKP